MPEKLFLDCSNTNFIFYQFQIFYQSRQGLSSRKSRTQSAVLVIPVVHTGIFLLLFQFQHECCLLPSGYAILSNICDRCLYGGYQEISSMFHQVPFPDERRTATKWKTSLALNEKAKGVTNKMKFWKGSEVMKSAYHKGDI